MDPVTWMLLGSALAENGSESAAQCATAFCQEVMFWFYCIALVVTIGMMAWMFTWNK